MSIIYKVAIGYNNSGGLAALNPQPLSRGIMWPERRYSPTGKAKSQGTPFTELEYSQIEASTCNSLLGQLGLTATVASLVESSEVTLQIIENTRVALICNAIVDLPESAKTMKWKMGFQNDVTFLVRHIEVIP